MTESTYTTQTPDTILSLKNIQKTFGGIHALSGVSFDLKEGEIHALVGENGAGKSTLIKTITGAYAPDGGTINIGGTEHDVFAAANAWREDGWAPNPDVAVESYDDNREEGFFVFVPIVRTEGQEDAEVPELPSDGKGGRNFVKQHSRPLGN